MPSLFAITVASNSLSLNAQRKGEAAFAVFNSSGRTVRGRAVLVPQGGAAPDWFSIAGEAEREFAPSGAAQYAVQIEIPLGAPPGEYSFRLDMVNVANPDEDYTQGQVVSFGVPESAEPFRIPWWAYAAAGVVGVLVVGGILFWWLWDGGVVVPDVANLSAEEARDLLEMEGFAVRPDVEEEFNPNVTVGQVIRTEPPVDTEVEPGTEVTLIVSRGPIVLTPPIVDPIEGNGNFVRDNTPAITGMVEAGTMVKILRDGVEAAAGTVSGGRFSITMPELEDRAHEFAAVVEDESGNASGPSEAITVTVDTTPPVWGEPQVLRGDLEGWNNTDVVVRFPCEDSLSGPEAGKEELEVSTQGEGSDLTVQARTEECIDQAGNPAADPRLLTAIKVDQTPPSYGDPARAPGSEPNSDGWNNADVTVHFPCEDSLSGPAAGREVVEVSSRGEGIDLVVVAPGEQCADQAGNVAAASRVFEDINVDKTRPTLAVSAVVALSLPSFYSASFNYSDGLSGIFSVECRLSTDRSWEQNCSSPWRSGTFNPGPDSPIVEVRVTDGAGNVRRACAPRDCPIIFPFPTIIPTPERELAPP